MKMVKEAEKKLFNCLIQRPAIDNKNEFIYTAGYTGYDFLDLSRLTLSPKTSERVVEMYEDLLEDLKKDYKLEFNKLAFIERTIGPMTIASQLSQRTGLESVVIKSRVPCSCKLCTKLRIKGSTEPPLSKQDKVVIVSDVLTTGGTTLGAIDIIEKNDAKVVAAVAILDRQVPDDMTVKEKIGGKGVKLHALTTRDKLLTLGFARPSEEDLKREDFLVELSKAIYLSEEETSLGKSLFDSIAEEILKNKKDVGINEENKKFIRNMLLSILINTRVSVLQAVEV